MSAPSGRTGTREREEVWAECAEFHEEPTRELRDPPEDRGGFRPPRWARLQNVLFWSLVPVALGALAILVALVTGHLVDDPRISTSSPSFSIRIAPNRQKVSQGSNASYAISLQAPPGFSDAILLSLGGATGRFSHDRLRPPATTVLTVTTSQKTLPGTYPIRITARTGNRVARVRVMLVVGAA
jgi:hypothetical protein